MASETIKTELVVKHMQVGEGADINKIKEAVLTQGAMTAGPRQQLAQGLAAGMPAERALLNDLAKIMGVQASSRMRASGTPQKTGRKIINAQGEEVEEMYTPTVEATVRSGPNFHRSDLERMLMKRRLERKLLGASDTPDDMAPSAEKMAHYIERASSEDFTAEGLIAFKYQAELFTQAQKDKRELDRFKASRRRKELAHKTGLQTYDPETGLRSFQLPLTPEQVDIHSKRLLDPLETEERKAESESVLKEELRTRRERARSTREGSRYDEKALKDIAQIEKDVEATRKRLDTTKMRERLDAANAKLNAQPGAITRAREQILDAMYMAGMRPDKRMTPEQVAALRPRLTPLQEREMRFLDRNKELDDKVLAYRKLSKEERIAPEGRTALEEIKKDKSALKEEAADLKTAQAREEERVRLENKAKAERYRAGGRLFEDAARDAFDPNKSAVVSGLLGAGRMYGQHLQRQGVEQIAAGGSIGTLAAGIGVTSAVNLLMSGLERGTELQKQAEKVYMAAEPMFAREEQLRAARRSGGDVSRFSAEAAIRAESAQRRLGMPDRPTAPSGRPADEDVYEDLATERLRVLRRHLGRSLGLSEATQAYGQFRRQAGVIDMSTEDAARAMSTGISSGLPFELLARAAQVGAISGNRGGGFRTGLDQRMDIGTLRYQKETLERAGLTGAPAEAILGQTLSRQESMAAMGMRTDFDREAKFQRILQEERIAPQQFGAITGSVDDIRTGLLQQLREPGKEILSGLMMAEAFRRGKTLQGAADYLAKTSGAQALEDQMQGVGPGTGLLPFVATFLAPAQQPEMMNALLRTREGQTAGPAAAAGSGDTDDAAYRRTELEELASYSAFGAQRSIGRKATIAQFHQGLDQVAKAMRHTADLVQHLGASTSAILSN